MSHSSTRAALVYQHLLASRDEEIAAHVDGLIRRLGDGGRGAASGT
ncbi:integrase [Streptacidiphilus sp. ASG 303]|nr:integrase [Streptacidiphilus sp. ASG 303]